MKFAAKMMAVMAMVTMVGCNENVGLAALDGLDSAISSAVETVVSGIFNVIIGWLPLPA
jgi:hypothetical protein